MRGHRGVRWPGRAVSELIGAADAFRKFVEERMPSARWRREIPSDAQVEGGA